MAKTAQITVRVQRVPRGYENNANRNPVNVKFREDFAYKIAKMTLETSLPDHLSPVESCLTCLNFNEQYECCKLNNLRPPARVIAFGCECYQDETEIPF